MQKCPPPKVVARVAIPSPAACGTPNLKREQHLSSPPSKKGSPHSRQAKSTASSSQQERKWAGTSDTGIVSAPGSYCCDAGRGRAGLRGPRGEAGEGRRRRALSGGHVAGPVGGAQGAPGVPSPGGKLRYEGPGPLLCSPGASAVLGLRGCSGFRGTPRLHLVTRIVSLSPALWL